MDTIGPAGGSGATETNERFSALNEKPFHNIVCFLRLKDRDSEPAARIEPGYGNLPRPRVPGRRQHLLPHHGRTGNRRVQARKNAAKNIYPKLSPTQYKQSDKMPCAVDFVNCFQKAPLVHKGGPSTRRLGYVDISSVSG